MKYPSTEEMRTVILKAIKEQEKDSVIRRAAIANLLEHRSPAQTRFVTRKLYQVYVLLPKKIAFGRRRVTKARTRKWYDQSIVKGATA